MAQRIPSAEVCELLGVEFARCPYCHEAVRPGREEPKRSCEDCMAWLHRDCWEDHGGCAVCNAFDGTMRRERVRPDRLRVFAPKALAGLAALAVFLIGLMLLHAPASASSSPLRDLNVRPSDWTQAGLRYKKGRGVQQDYAKALDWFRKAAAKGDADGMHYAGIAYQYGQGVEQDYARAANWYQRAADAGLPKAMVRLGRRYELGQGREKDPRKAAQWYLVAALAGYRWGMHNTGHCYEHGLGVQRDAAEAARWYRKAADAGYAASMHSLGGLLERGKGVPQDLAQAVWLYREAALAGHARARASLLILLDRHPELR